MSKFIPVASVLTVLGGAISSALAAGSIPNQQLQFSDVQTILTTLSDWMFLVLLAIAVIFIIIAAYRYLTAEGDESKVSSAHKTLIYALVAIGVALLSKGIIYLVGELTGTQIPAF